MVNYNRLEQLYEELKKDKQYKHLLQTLDMENKMIGAYTSKEEKETDNNVIFNIEI